MARLFLILSSFLTFAMANAQDVKTAYNLTRISSYVCVDHVGYETISELRDTLQSLGERFHSVDFVIDMLHADGERMIDESIVRDSLEGHYQRIAFLVGPHTQSGAAHIAHVLRKADKAIIVGDSANNGLKVDIVLKSNEAYRTAWMDSLHQHRVIHKAAERFVRENREMLSSRFPMPKDLYLNYDQNAEYMDVLYAVAAEKGISRNDEAFYYSGFTLLSEAKSEVLHQLFPDEKPYYHRSLNHPIEQAISIARETLESSQFKKLLGVKW